MSFIKGYSRIFQGYIIIMFNYTEVKNFCTLLYIYKRNKIYHKMYRTKLCKLSKQASFYMRIFLLEIEDKILLDLFLTLRT